MEFATSNARGFRKLYRFSLLSLFGLVTATAIGFRWYFGDPHVLLDGYCPVTLHEEEKWVPGHRWYSVVFMKGKYYCAGKPEYELFVANPERFAAVLNGYDVVIAVDQGKKVLGARRHGLFCNDIVYLFSSEATSHQFQLDPRRYSESAAQQALNRQQRLSARSLRDRRVGDPAQYP